MSIIYVSGLLQRVLSNADLNLVSELHLLMQHTNGTLGELRGLIMGEILSVTEFVIL